MYKRQIQACTEGTCVVSELSQAFAAIAAAVTDESAAAGLAVGAEMRHIQLFLRDGIASVVYQIKVHGLASSRKKSDVMHTRICSPLWIL